MGVCGGIEEESGLGGNTHFMTALLSIELPVPITIVN